MGSQHPLEGGFGTAKEARYVNFVLNRNYISDSFTTLLPQIKTTSRITLRTLITNIRRKKQIFTAVPQCHIPFCQIVPVKRSADNLNGKRTPAAATKLQKTYLNSISNKSRLELNVR